MHPPQKNWWIVALCSWPQLWGHAPKIIKIIFGCRLLRLLAVAVTCVFQCACLWAWLSAPGFAFGRELQMQPCWLADIGSRCSVLDGTLGSASVALALNSIESHLSKISYGRLLCCAWLLAHLFLALPLTLVSQHGKK